MRKLIIGGAIAALAITAGTAQAEVGGPGHTLASLRAYVVSEDISHDRAQTLANRRIKALQVKVATLQVQVANLNAEVDQLVQDEQAEHHHHHGDGDGQGGDDSGS